MKKFYKKNILKLTKRALNTDSKSDDNRTWLCCGNLFIAMDKDKATSFIEKGPFDLIK
jgi:hypothetical protein